MNSVWPGFEIESEPDREDLACLLERESKLGSVYAGVLVDHAMAGVEHSLRWDVLPVRIRAAKQHAKLSLLVWSRHVRVIVASANLTDPGYRTNYEVAGVVDLSPGEANLQLLAEAVAFLRSLIELVPGAAERPPEIRRATEFLDKTESTAASWPPMPRRGTIRQQLTCTLPKADEAHPARSSLTEAVEACRRRVGSPNEAWIASPFFDPDPKRSRATEALCKAMARDSKRKLRFCVPSAPNSGSTSSVPRLAAPKALILSAKLYEADFKVEMLPQLDADKNPRPWHAKMLALQSPKYSAMMVGSSNFTGAGLGVGAHHNAEVLIRRSGWGRKRNSTKMSRQQDRCYQRASFPPPTAPETTGA
ncbi:MAG: hypothetical protein IPF82_16850 [Blastocatellia bacterium]|nr:hypothetical protein [Blastocatellia bacterium]